MSLVIPGTSRPSNLHFAEGVKVVPVDSDMYGICERIKEISPRLFIVVAHDNDKHKFIIVEHCEDGVDRMVYGVAELDARVLKRLQYIMSIPLQERLAQLEKEEWEFEQQKAEEDFEDLYERMGGPMLHELYNTGFADNPRSAPKRNKTARRHRSLKGQVGG
jgi:hypothetical protein